MEIKKPYLLFLGDAPDVLALKTAFGVMDWRPEWVIGQYRFDECKVSVGAQDMSLKEAWDQGARSLVIGVVNPGGVLPPQWLPTLLEAMRLGFDIVSGMHQKLQDIPEIQHMQSQLEKPVNLINLRFVDKSFSTAKGIKREGKRVLTVGTDCSVGKKYTALALYKIFQKHHHDVRFCATGQTGVLIAEEGIAIDSVIADFIAGAAETLSPATGTDTWSFIEGQGSLFHPSFAGVTLGLLHGSQPDYFIVCHETTRKTMRNVNTPMPDVADVIKQTIIHGQLTNPAIQCAGISINTSCLNEQEAKKILASFAQEYDLPCCDPVRFGCDDIYTYLLKLDSQ